MRALDRYIAGNVFNAAFLVLAAVVSLDVMFTWTRELGFLRGNYDAWAAFEFVITTLPSRIYEFIPVAALMGGLIGLGLLANSNELVVMRSAGISILRIVGAALFPVLFFALTALGLGQWVIPVSEKLAESNRAMAEMSVGEEHVAAHFGQWYKDGDIIVHAHVVEPNGKLHGLERYVYEAGILRRASYARVATYQGDGVWFVEEVRSSYIGDDRVSVESVPYEYWQSELTPAILSLSIVSPDALAISDLYAFAHRREKEGLDSDRFYLAFWQKVMQPVVTLLMVLLAAGFIFGSLRQVTMGYRLAIGIAAGLAFRYGQDLLSHASLVFGLDPMVSVVLPALVFGVFAVWSIRRAG